MTDSGRYPATNRHEIVNHSGPSEFLERTIDRSSRSVVPYHRGTNAVGYVVGRAMHQVAVKYQQVSGIHQNRNSTRHVVIHDLSVAVISIGAAIANVFMNRFTMRARQDVQATVFQR